MADDKDDEVNETEIPVSEDQAAPEASDAVESAASEEAPAKSKDPEGMSLQEIHDPKDLIDDAEKYEMGEPMVKDVEAIYDVPVQISAVLGRSTMQVSQLLKLGRGAVVELDRKVGEAIDIYVNNRLVARGEVVVVEDKLGITMTEIVKSDKV